MRLVTNVALLLLTFAAVADAAVLRVPFEYATITAAANAAQSGDSIQVWPLESGEDWEFQQIMLRQGVILRGMTPVNFANEVVILNSDVHLLDGPANRGLDDTTRVENLVIGSPMFYESIQVFSPRSSIRGCKVGSLGPQEFYAIRVWEGGSIIGNHFSGDQGGGVIARQGTVIVAWNTFFRALDTLVLDTRNAPEAVELSFRNNDTFDSEELVLFLRQDSNVELVNNIFDQLGFLVCFGEGSASLRHNDIWPSTVTACVLGNGNIAADPLYCQGPPGANSLWLTPNSPCVGAGEGGLNIGAGGICGVTSVADAAESSKPRVRLEVTPNPVRVRTEFRVSGTSEPTALEIYDAAGRVVDIIQPGRAPYVWEPSSSVRPGVYFVRLRANEASATSKFVVLPR